MKVLQLRIKIYKEGEDADLSVVKPLLKEIGEKLKEKGHLCRIDLSSEMEQDKK